MKKNVINALTLVAGLALLGAGLYLVETVFAPTGVMLALPYVFIGLGCGMFGQGVSGFVNRAVLKKNPEIAKQQEIEQKDERNQEIANRAKAKAYDAMVFVFGALMVAFALMGMDLVPVLLLVGAYLYVVGVGLYYRFKLEKEL